MKQTVTASQWPSEEQVFTDLRRQAQVHDRLAALSTTQQSLVRADDPSPLLSLLNERQTLVNELAVIHRRLTPVRAEWGRFRSRLNPARRREADALVDRARTALARLIERDEQDARVLAARKQMTARALSTTYRRREAVAAYRSAPTRPHRVDRQSES